MNKLIPSYENTLAQHRVESALKEIIALYSTAREERNSAFDLKNLRNWEAWATVSYGLAGIIGILGGQLPE